MICRFVVLAVSIAASSAWAQSSTNSTTTTSGAVNGNSVISSGPAAGSSALGGANVTITNQSGGTFTVADLAHQLQNLKGAVDQTMPMLTSFNARYSSANNGAGGLAGALSGLLHRNGNQGQNQSTSELTNVLSALRSLLSTNGSSSSVAISATTLSDLQALQRDLEPTIPLLQSLAGSTSSGTTTGSRNYGYEANTNQAPLAPTGR